MGEINIPRDQQNALAAIDVTELDRLIKQAIREGRSGDLCQLSLENCGSFIAMQLHYFEQALRNQREARAPKKRAEAGDAVLRAGHKLSFAVGAMKLRMEAEKKEGQLFFVDDEIRPPYRFSQHLSVRVDYRWRRTVDTEWTFGNITFIHDAPLRANHVIPTPKRKLSAANQEHDLQNRLCQSWEDLMRNALHSVRDYFRGGGDGDNIPVTFRVAVDPYDQGLNNHSTQFWRQHP